MIPNVNVVTDTHERKKKEAFNIAFGTLKHPWYGFLNNFLSIMNTSYRKGVHQFRGWPDYSDFGF